MSCALDNTKLCACRKGAQNTVQIAPWMVQRVVQTTCKLHMFLHLHGAKDGANEAPRSCKQWFTCNLHLFLHLLGERFSTDDVKFAYVLSN